MRRVISNPAPAESILSKNIADTSDASDAIFPLPMPSERSIYVRSPLSKVQMVSPDTSACVFSAKTAVSSASVPSVSASSGISVPFARAVRIASPERR